MRHSALQKSAGVLATFGLLAVSLLPQEHVHIVRTDDAHHSEVVHRHYEAHHPENGSVFDHGDGDVEWLTAPFTRPQVPPPIELVLQFAPVPATLDPQTAAVRAPFRVVRVSVHDPPWTPSSALRAPPSLS